jgi:septum site-determining protein MinD
MDFEYIVCDSPAGIETGALMAMHFADEAIVVTNPEVSSVRDSDRILGMLATARPSVRKMAADPIKEHLLITRYNPNRVEGARCCRWTMFRTSCAGQAHRRDPGERRPC